MNDTQTLANALEVIKLWSPIIVKYIIPALVWLVSTVYYLITKHKLDNKKLQKAEDYIIDKFNTIITNVEHEIELQYKQGKIKKEEKPIIKKEVAIKQILAETKKDKSFVKALKTIGLNLAENTLLDFASYGIEKLLLGGKLQLPRVRLKVRF